MLFGVMATAPKTPRSELRWYHELGTGGPDYARAEGEQSLGYGVVREFVASECAVI